MHDQPAQPDSLVVQAPRSSPLSDQAAPLIPPADLIVEAEWVRRYPARRKYTWIRWLAALLKVGAAFTLAWLFYVLPTGTLPGLLQTWKNPVIIFFLICFIGKTLLDTFFYDHYQP
jgi:hypothetical protein